MLRISRRNWLRKAHRYLGLIAGLQLLFWTVSGLYFSLVPIADVRGESSTAKPVGLPVRADLASPAPALQALVKSTPKMGPVQSVSLKTLLGKPVYEVVYLSDGVRLFALADALSGQLRPPLASSEATAIALADFVPKAQVRSVERLTAVPSDSEYREHELPAYRVSFDHPSNTRIYVSEQRGTVTARRNDLWRAFDWFWMLHIMDYRNRDSFNHWLLQAFSALGVITVLSGFALWASTTSLLRPRKRIRVMPSSYRN